MMIREQAKTYRLHVALSGTVYYEDDSGCSWTHVRGNGEIHPRIVEALATGHITYHFPKKTPKYFSIVETDHVLDEGDHFVSIRTDSTRLSRLRELEREVNIKFELEVLKRQRDEIQRKIDELEQVE